MTEEEKQDQIKILVVDDSDDARIGISAYLKSEGFIIDEAESGEKAIELLEKSEYNIVVSDLKMQNIDGIGVLKKVKELNPETEVIIMTAYASIKTAVGAIKLGAFDYISKPLNMDELLHLIKNSLEKQRLAHEISGLKEVINLYEVSKGMTTIMELQKLLSLIINLAADTIYADGGSIMLLDSKTEQLTVMEAIGSDEKAKIGKKIKLGERIAGFAAQKEFPVKIDGSLKDDPRFAKLTEYHDGITSGLVVPMVKSDKLLGVINLHRGKSKNKFTDNEMKLLSIFAAQAASAIENSYLFSDLEKEHDKLNGLFNEMGDGAIITDSDFRIILSNSAALDLLELDQKKYTGIEFSAISERFDPSITFDKIKDFPDDILKFNLVRTIEPFTFLAVTATKITDKNDEIQNYILVLRNISAEKREELIKKNFLRLMSHKLRTPLTSILGFSGHLTSEETYEKLTPSEQNGLSIIKSESLHLASLVDKLLRFTLLETETLSLSKSETDIFKLLKESLANQESEINSNNVIVIITKSLEKLPKIQIDKEKILEVFDNIIENAIKFNDSEKKEISIDGVLEADKVIKISVSDNGPGIPEHLHQKVFEKFHQIEDYFTGQVKGVGLGLSLAKKLIESHEGQIHVEDNESSRGCKFVITLPVRN